MARVTCASRSARTRKSRSRTMPSSASRQRAYAGLTRGRIAAFNRLSSRPRWGMSIAASSSTWEARSNRIVSFLASDNTCPNCTFGYPSSCEHREFVGTAQAPRAARTPCGRLTRRHSGRSVAGADPEPARAFGRPGRGLVCRRCGQRKAGLDGHGGRRRRGRIAGRPLREADGRGANHRDEPSREAPER